MAKRNYEYNADSIHGGGADLGGANTTQCRKEVVQYWDRDSDLVYITRIQNGFPIIGFIGFNRRTDLYFWLTKAGVCRNFDPRNGKLGKTIPIPKGTLKAIEHYAKKNPKMADKLAIKRRL